MKTKREAALIRSTTDPALQKKKLNDHRKAVWKDEQDKKRIKK